MQLSKGSIVLSLVSERSSIDTLGRSTSRRRFLVAAAAAAGMSTVRRGFASPGVSKGAFRDIDDSAESWITYIDPPQDADPSTWAEVKNVIGRHGDGAALNIGIRGGSPYTGIMAYSDLHHIPEARAFELELDWQFSPTTWNNEGEPSVVQAVELTISKWTRAHRYEWALQWQNVDDGTNAAADGPTWRVWTGTHWRDTGVGQRLAPDEWHAFRLRGAIAGGAVQYVSFASDDVSANLGHTFGPAPTFGSERLTVALQLDGNYAQGNYDCLFDHVGVRWWSEPIW